MDDELSPVTELIMVTPFESDLTTLAVEEQLVKLKGCVLCQITRDLDNGSVRSKAEWKTCKQELGIPVTVVAQYQADPALLELVGGRAPVVIARSKRGLFELSDATVAWLGLRG